MGTAFYKMNGLGNDFVVVDARARHVRFSAEVARRIGDRHRGVGFDQMLSIEPANGAGDVAMRIWNTDGSLSEACGNGTRCVADLLMAESKKDSVTIATAGGLLSCKREADGRVTVDMGEPKLEWQDIPLSERMDTRVLDIQLGPIDAPVLVGPSAVNMGNPHCIFFVADAEAHDLKKIGPMIEYHPLFPERANISLAQVRSKSEVRLRVWERGVGLTQACGSAACAATVAAARKKFTDRKVRIVLDGGTLDIEWRDDNHVLMTGPTELNYTGELSDRYFAS
ncbi:MAG: diaminopimelate epimerase [Alphaproteobacteria bacterium]|nr:diaminopimelate epimerase [Alphaproteobacteria bacterium]